MLRAKETVFGSSKPCSSAGRTPVHRQSVVAHSAPVQLMVQTKEVPVINLTVESGSILRTALLSEKVDLYTTWGKVWQCGGGGNCGTCVVEIKEGMELLSERTAAETKKLSRKPTTWRLACQTLVGDGETTGCVTIATKPQK